MENLKELIKSIYEKYAVEIDDMEQLNTAILSLDDLSTGIDNQEVESLKLEVENLTTALNELHIKFREMFIKDLNTLKEPENKEPEKEEVMSLDELMGGE